MLAAAKSALTLLLERRLRFGGGGCGVKNTVTEEPLGVLAVPRQQTWHRTHFGQALYVTRR